MNESLALAWSNELVIGFPEIDAEHRILIDLINNLAHQRVSGAIGTKLLDTVKELRRYTEYHFRHEEDLMRQYPVSEDHRQTHLKAHHGFIERLRSVEKLVLSNSADVIDHLMAFLVKWLVFHIGGIDAALAKEVVALRAGTPPDQIKSDKSILENGLIKTVSELYDGLGLRTFEMLELNKELKEEIEQRKRVEEELKLAALVYQNADEGMLITDSDNLIVAVNPAFTKITGFTHDEVLGRNPKILGTKRQEAGFYKAMWQAILEDGHWRGEVWNQRKNGEIYAEQLTISTICNEDGTIHRYVGLFSDITEKKNAEVELSKRANYDQLTQLPNRRLFHDRLEQELKKSNRDGSHCALMFLDLDHFKDINDSLGHEAGDTLLVEAAKRIQSCVRESDTVARLGGDEFTVILSDLTDLSNIARIAQDIISKLNEAFHIKNEELFISGSVGIAAFPNDANNVTDLIKNADQAMYKAKADGRGRFYFFTKGMQVASELRIKLAFDLRRALESGQFEVHYQPIVELATGHIHKAEALLRWKHPEHGLVSPAAFIPIAEDTGTIHEIGDWVFRQAIDKIKHWQLIRGSDFQISINQSPVQFKENNIGYGQWLERLNEIGLPGKSIVIEITEGLLMNDDTSITDKLLKYRDSGIQVAIDDFGTGYSALSYLKKFDIDYLKIDQSFVRNLTPNATDFVLCEAIVVMAHKLGLKVIAEGVETEQQRALLKQIGCDYGQGYLFSKPVPAEEFEVLMRGSRILCKRDLG